MPLSEHNTPRTITISSAFSLSPPKISVEQKSKAQPYEIERKRAIKKEEQKVKQLGLNAEILSSAQLSYLNLPAAKSHS